MKIDLDNLKRNLINLQNIVKIYDNITIIQQDEIFDVLNNNMYSWDVCSDSFQIMTINNISVSCKGNLEIPGNIISSYGLYEIKIVEQIDDNFIITVKTLNVINSNDQPGPIEDDPIYKDDIIENELLKDTTVEIKDVQVYGQGGTMGESTDYIEDNETNVIKQNLPYDNTYKVKTPMRTIHAKQNSLNNLKKKFQDDININKIEDLNFVYNCEVINCSLLNVIISCCPIDSQGRYYSESTTLMHLPIGNHDGNTISDDFEYKDEIRAIHIPYGLIMTIKNKGVDQTPAEIIGDAILLDEKIGDSINPSEYQGTIITLFNLDGIIQNSMLEVKINKDVCSPYDVPFSHESPFNLVQLSGRINKNLDNTMDEMDKLKFNMLSHDAPTVLYYITNRFRDKLVNWHDQSEQQETIDAQVFFTDSYIGSKRGMIKGVQVVEKNDDGLKPAYASNGKLSIGAYSNIREALPNIYKPEPYDKGWQDMTLDGVYIPKGLALKLYTEKNFSGASEYYPAKNNDIYLCSGPIKEIEYITGGYDEGLDVRPVNLYDYNYGSIIISEVSDTGEDLSEELLTSGDVPECFNIEEVSYNPSQTFLDRFHYDYKFKPKYSILNNTHYFKLYVSTLYEGIMGGKLYNNGNILLPTIEPFKSSILNELNLYKKYNTKFSKYVEFGDHSDLISELSEILDPVDTMNTNTNEYIKEILPKIHTLYIPDGVIATIHDEKNFNGNTITVIGPKILTDISLYELQEFIDYKYIYDHVFIDNLHEKIKSVNVSLIIDDKNYIYDYNLKQLKRVDQDTPNSYKHPQDALDSITWGDLGEPEEDSLYNTYFDYLLNHSEIVLIDPTEQIFLFDNMLPKISDTGDIPFEEWINKIEYTYGLQCKWVYGPHVENGYVINGPYPVFLSKKDSFTKALVEENIYYLHLYDSIEECSNDGIKSYCKDINHVLETTNNTKDKMETRFKGYHANYKEIYNQYKVINYYLDLSFNSNKRLYDYTKDKKVYVSESLLKEDNYRNSKNPILAEEIYLRINDQYIFDSFVMPYTKIPLSWQLDIGKEYNIQYVMNRIIRSIYVPSGTMIFLIDSNDECHRIMGERYVILLSHWMYGIKISDEYMEYVKKEIKDRYSNTASGYLMIMENLIPKKIITTMVSKEIITYDDINIATDVNSFDNMPVSISILYYANTLTKEDIENMYERSNIFMSTPYMCYVINKDYKGESYPSMFLFDEGQYYDISKYTDNPILKTEGASSIYIQSGWTIAIYEKNNFKGSGYFFKGPLLLVDNLNDVKQVYLDYFEDGSNEINNIQFLYNLRYLIRDGSMKIYPTDDEEPENEINESGILTIEGGGQIIDASKSNELENEELKKIDFDKLILDKTNIINVETLLKEDFSDSTINENLLIGDASYRDTFEYEGLHIFGNKNTEDEMYITINKETNNNFLEINNYNKYNQLFFKEGLLPTYLNNDEIIIVSYNFYVNQTSEPDNVEPYIEFLSNSLIRTNSDNFKFYGNRYDKIGINNGEKNLYYANVIDIFGEPLTNKWRKIKVYIHNQQLTFMIDNYRLYEFLPTEGIDLTQMYITIFPFTSVWFDNIQVGKIRFKK